MNPNSPISPAEKRAAVCLFILGLYFLFNIFPSLNSKAVKTEVSKPPVPTVLYTGKIYNIFFHSLIIYPELAFIKDQNKTSLDQILEKYMITRDEFNRLLPQLYKNNFVLIDVSSIYNVDANGTVTQKKLYLPVGKKPLIISIDDMSYYRLQRGRGLANKLVLDDNGNISTEVITPDKRRIVTRDGDIVPILDDFVTAHPDFSIGGAKGIIALTGHDGILGYRNEDDTAKLVVSKLKNTGWRFASHSYAHDGPFMDGSISLEELRSDTERWDREVRPLLGNTDIFVGPFGQIFSHDDPRRNYLVSHGFKIIYGVGMDLYFHNYPDYIIMDRADIDGFRLTEKPSLLRQYFDPDIVRDPIRTHSSDARVEINSI